MDMEREPSNPLGAPEVGLPEYAEHGPPAGVASGLACRLFARLMRRAGNPPVAFALANGRVLHDVPGRPVGRVVFRDAGVLWDVLRHPELGFGDAFSAGRVRVKGDLVEVLSHLFRATEEAGARRGKRGVFATLPRPRGNARQRVRDGVQRHHELGNDFYALWLDERMVYTCAYYAQPDMTLEQAQVAKLEHVSRKLELRPGMRVLEAGCGCGALALHMAREHGVSVRAIDISGEQIAHAREEARRQGLGTRVEFVEDDYRNVTGSYDAFVAVGMLEHLGRENLGQLGRVVARSLNPGGRALLHGVGRSRASPPNAWLERRIFPGSYLPSLRELMAILEPHRFSVLDLENLRLHYERTLIDWLARFDAHESQVRDAYGASFARAWRLYLAGCAAAFRAGSIQLYQVLFAHPEDKGVPMTRAHVYGGGAPLTWPD
jgi:cyclopropane-fatty-acyl-phospholipid synthase